MRRVGTTVCARLQVKRIHEYKRQLLNVLGIIWRYDQIKRMTPEQKAQVRAAIRSVCATCAVTCFASFGLRELPCACLLHSSLQATISL